MSYLAFPLLGLGSGAVYAALALGLVLTYRGSRVVNFAYGAMAMHSLCSNPDLGERAVRAVLHVDEPEHDGSASRSRAARGSGLGPAPAASDRGEQRETQRAHERGAEPGRVPVPVPGAASIETFEDLVAARRPRSRGTPHRPPNVLR